MNQNLNESIRKEIFINCRPKILFGFFTDPEKMVRWMGRHILLEPRIGGSYRIDVNGQDIAKGEYLEIVPYEKIVMSWGWKDSEILPPGLSTLEFRLIPKDSGTLLVLTHYNLPQEKVQSHLDGWIHYMTRLLTLTEGQNPGIDPWSIINTES